LSAKDSLVTWSLAVDQSVIARAVTVAGGRFAPGHLGELTQQVPFEMVDAVLEETCRVQRRVRVLPSRVVVYLLLAGCLFAELGYSQVWQRVAAGLGGLPVTVPTASAMTQARRRLGPAPLRELFFLLRGPSPGGARWRGLLVCAIDGTIMTVADSEANLAVYSRQRGGPNGASGYPMLRLLALVSCGTRTVIDAVFGPVCSGETTYAPGLLASLHAGMILLADRGFGAGFLAAQIARTRADFLIRVRAGYGAPGLPVLSRLPDGSWLSRFGGIAVRVIDAQVTVTTSAGHATAGCRLVTTLLDPVRYPAGDLAVLYHERWEVETAYFELKSTILGGRVLRARTPDGIEQEIYALLVTYQALRTAIADAAGTVPGTDPDRASFAVALNASRDQVILAAGVLAGPATDLAGKIGRLVLASLMPSRRLRVSPRVVKRAMSRYNARGKVDRATRKAVIAIAILGAPLTPDDEP
jgi:Insertion element 4 transposase N-terminal/Transposase DDE domain